MITILVPPGASAGDALELDETEVHHLRVRRISEAPVAVRDGAGLVAEGRIVQRGRRMLVEIDHAERVARPAPLLLAIGAGDRERFALVTEKAAELSVTRVVPVETERSRSVAGRVRPEHVERLQRRAVEAVKQSGAAWAPDVDVPTPLEQFLERQGSAKGSDAWLADAGGAAPPAELAPVRAVTVLIGPEGGLTASERAAALAAGYVATGLGPHVLRFETAAIAAAVAANIARRRGAR